MKKKRNNKTNTIGEKSEQSDKGKMCRNDRHYHRPELRVEKKEKKQFEACVFAACFVFLFFFLCISFFVHIRPKLKTFFVRLFFLNFFFSFFYFFHTLCYPNSIFCNTMHCRVGAAFICGHFCVRPKAIEIALFLLLLPLLLLLLLFTSSD